MELKSAKKIKSIYYLMVFGFIFAALGIIITAVNPASKSIDIINILSIFFQYVVCFLHTYIHCYNFILFFFVH